MENTLGSGGHQKHYEDLVSSLKNKVKNFLLLSEVH